MRQALVDRHRNRLKPAQHHVVDAELDAIAAARPLPPTDPWALDEALTELEG